MFSTHCPLDDHISVTAGNSFETEQWRMTWTGAGEEVNVPFYRRPVSEVNDPLVDTGFRVDQLVEPKPRETFGEKQPEYDEIRLPSPTFLCARSSNVD